MAKLNLTKTQSGYVPLDERRKSFPADSENTPNSDVEVYFDNYANQTLEHADLGLLYPTPDWLKKRLFYQRNPGLFTSYRVTAQNVSRVTSTGSYRFTRQVE